MHGFNIIQLSNIVTALGGFIAGGACRSLHNNEEINDYDIFCTTEESYSLLKSWLLQVYGKVRENALVLQVGNIQLIKPREEKYIKTYGQPRDVVSKFDFSVCRGYFDNYSKQVVWLESTTESDLNKKRLIVQNIVCPISTFRRSLKYAKKGYFLPITEIFKLYNEYTKRSNEDPSFSLFLTELENKKDDDDFSLYELMLKHGVD